VAVKFAFAIAADMVTTNCPAELGSSPQHAQLPYRVEEPTVD